MEKFDSSSNDFNNRCGNFKECQGNKETTDSLKPIEVFNNSGKIKAVN